MLIEELVTKGAELHHICLTSRTPLLGLLDSFFGIFEKREYLSILLFDHWLQALAKCDVDLEQYGRTEIDLHERGLVNWEFEDQSMFLYSPGSVVLWTMKELYYGKSPRDWGFYIEADRYTTDEGLEYNMPGAWIDEQSMSEEEEGVVEDGDLARRAGDEEEPAEIIEDDNNSEERSDEGESLNEDTDSNGVWEDSQDSVSKELRDEKRIVKTEIIDKSPADSSPGAGEYIWVVQCDPLDLTKYKKIMIRH